MSLPKILSDYVAVQNNLVRILQENPQLHVATTKSCFGLRAKNIIEFSKVYFKPIEEIILSRDSRRIFLEKYFKRVNETDAYPDWTYVRDLELPYRNKLIADMQYQIHYLKLNGEDDYSRRLVFGGNCISFCQIGLVTAEYIPDIIQTEIWVDFLCRSTNVNDTLIIDIETCYKILDEYWLSLREHRKRNEYPINMTINLSRAHVFRKTPEIWRRKND